MHLVDRLKASDVDEVARIAQDALSEPLAADAFLVDTCLVAREPGSGAVLGFAVAARGDALDGKLIALAVAQGRAGQGIGSSLLREVEHALAGQGSRTLDLDVRADDPGARAFYQRHGFVSTGLHSHVYSDGGDAVHMTRPL